MLFASVFRVAYLSDVIYYTSEFFICQELFSSFFNKLYFVSDALLTSATWLILHKNRQFVKHFFQNTYT